MQKFWRANFAKRIVWKPRRQDQYRTFHSFVCWLISEYFRVFILLQKHNASNSLIYKILSNDMCMENDNLLNAINGLKPKLNVKRTWDMISIRIKWFLMKLLNFTWFKGKGESVFNCIDVWSKENKGKCIFISYCFSARFLFRYSMKYFAEQSF